MTYDGVRARWSVELQLNSIADPRQRTLLYGQTVVKAYKSVRSRATTLSPVTTENLADTYQRYLHCLNERRWDDLGDFVADELSYNSTPMTLGDYRAARQAEARAIPDLQFTAELVVADDDTVAARLFFRCTPTEPFLGFEPTGALISFAEHVFYKFRDQKIVQVWSLLDVPAIAGQMAQHS